MGLEIDGWLFVLIVFGSWVLGYFMRKLAEENKECPTCHGEGTVKRYKR
jgi:hypothetical protein